jgi:hypothetical protein
MDFIDKLFFTKKTGKGLPDNISVYFENGFVPNSITFLSLLCLGFILLVITFIISKIKKDKIRDLKVEKINLKKMRTMLDPPKESLKGKRINLFKRNTDESDPYEEEVKNSEENKNNNNETINSGVKKEEIKRNRKGRKSMSKETLNELYTMQDKYKNDLEVQDFNFSERKYKKCSLEALRNYLLYNYFIRLYQVTQTKTTLTCLIVLFHYDPEFTQPYELAIAVVVLIIWIIFLPFVLFLYLRHNKYDLISPKNIIKYGTLYVNYRGINKDVYAFLMQIKFVILPVVCATCYRFPDLQLILMICLFLFNIVFITVSMPFTKMSKVFTEAISEFLLMCVMIITTIHNYVSSISDNVYMRWVNFGFFAALFIIRIYRIIYDFIFKFKDMIRMRTYRHISSTLEDNVEYIDDEDENGTNNDKSQMSQVDDLQSIHNKRDTINSFNNKFTTTIDINNNNNKDYFNENNSGLDGSHTIRKFLDRSNNNTRVLSEMYQASVHSVKEDDEEMATDQNLIPEQNESQHYNKSVASKNLIKLKKPFRFKKKNIDSPKEVESLQSQQHSLTEKDNNSKYSEYSKNSNNDKNNTTNRYTLSTINQTNLRMNDEIEEEDDVIEEENNSYEDDKNNNSYSRSYNQYSFQKYGPYKGNTYEENNDENDGEYSNSIKNSNSNYNSNSSKKYSNTNSEYNSQSSNKYPEKKKNHYNVNESRRDTNEKTNLEDRTKIQNNTNERDDEDGSDSEYTYTYTYTYTSNSHNSDEEKNANASKKQQLNNNNEKKKDGNNKKR